jgi:carbonic anhydrase/acetyltransferase-like protein (isoleucine patch superfamily)
MSIYEYDGQRPQISRTAFIHPQAIIIGHVTIGDYCFIAPGAVIRGDFGIIEIGSGTNIQENAVIHTQPNTIAKISENVLISHGAIVHGACKLEAYSSVGIGAIICPDCTLGTESFLAAGSLLPPNKKIPGRHLAVGSPAQIKKELDEATVAKNKQAILHYQQLAKKCSTTLKLIKDC